MCWTLTKTVSNRSEGTRKSLNVTEDAYNPKTEVDTHGLSL